MIGLRLFVFSDRLNKRRSQFNLTEHYSQAATEQRSRTGDKNTESFPKNVTWGENKWFSEQPVGKATSSNDKTKLCESCNSLQKEYGRVLFERDLAQKKFKVASFCRGNESQQQRNDGIAGMNVLNSLFYFTGGVPHVSTT